MSTEYFQSLIDPRIFKKYYTERTLLHRIAQVIVETVAYSVMMDIDARGVNNIPSTGPLILAVNHLAFADVMPVQFVMGQRPIFYMAKEELFRNPLVDILFRSLLAFPVQRGLRDAWAMDFAVQLLDKGQVVGIFPEGTRSRGSGLGRGKTGAARLALEANCPILPMAIDGTQRMFKYFPNKTRVTVNVAEPIFPQPQETVEDLMLRVMQTISEMLPTELRGNYS